ncbi:MAG: hypothetical protein ABSD11_10870 [Methylocella sp.]
MMRSSERPYQMLQKLAKKCVLLVEPRDNAHPLVVAVIELARVTVDEAKRRPDKVRAAILKTLDKEIQKAAEKPLVRRRMFDGRRSIPSGPHRLNHSKPVDAASLEQFVDARTIESPNP